MVAYHLQLGWASGGYLGVDLFFVLSGFLITTLLLEEWVGSSRINLAAFWGRRARRLLPALFLVVGALGVYLVANALFGGPGANGLVDLPGLRGDAISTLLYVNNWHAIFAHQSYFAQFSAPSPLQHTWSLAIEEQFYLVWPLVLLLLLHVARRGWRTTGIILTVTLGVLSSILMAVAVQPGNGPHEGLLRDGHPALRPDGGRDAGLRRRGAPATEPAGAPDAARGRPGGRRGPRRLLGQGGHAERASHQLHVRGRLPDLRRPRRPGRRRRPARRAGAVLPGARLEAAALHRDHLLRHLPVALARDRVPQRARTGLPALPLDLLRVGVTLAVSTASYYLVERPVRLARLRGWARLWVAPLAGVVTAVVIVVATIPAVADPSRVVGTTHLAAASAAGSGTTVPGSGGYGGQEPIRLATPPSSADPLRVMILGDSVMHDASYGITAALQATGEATVATRTIDGFGLTTATDWPTSIPNLIRQTRAQLIVASWSWDQYGPTTPNALHQPAQYTRLLRRAVATMLTPGNGVEGVIFTEFPQSGALPASDPADQAAYNKERWDGVVAWNAIAATMASDFPGRVMYFPLAGSVLLDGRYSAWLPPEGDPHAPSDQWIRVRKLDNVHLCPEGSARYADALLTDMRAVFALAPAAGDWSQASWTTDPNFNDPPGACPDDHPPGG